MEMDRKTGFFLLCNDMGFAFSTYSMCSTREFCWLVLSTRTGGVAWILAIQWEYTLQLSSVLSLEVCMFCLLYRFLPPIPIIATAILTYSQHCFAIMNNGTGGSFALVKCNCSSRLTMLMKLAMEKTDMERDVSFRIANRGCMI
jgi:hypothetical protein